MWKCITDSIPCVEARPGCAGELQRKKERWEEKSKEMEETRMGKGSEGQFLPAHFLDAGMDNTDDHPESQ